MRTVSTLLIIALGLGNAISQAQTRAPLPIRYNLNVKVVPDAHRLEVDGTMTIPSSKESREVIQLSLNELMGDFKLEVVGPRASAGATRLEKAGLDGREVTWKVFPVRPFPAGENIELRFSYSGGEKLTYLFYVGPEVSFASAYGTYWYPIFLGGPDRGVGSLNISVPPGQTAIGEGKKRSTPEQERRGTFRFVNDLPDYFSFAAGKYITVRRGGPIPVSVHLLHKRENMDQYLERVAELLAVLEREFGTYRFNQLALVEVPRDLAQKAGFNGATLQGFSLINSNAFNLAPSKFDAILEWYGHEFSHNWWPHTVSLKRPGGWATEESLAEYGGSRVVETIAGPALAEQHRRTGYPADPIYSALEYFKLVGRGLDKKLGDLPRDPQSLNIAWNKGFLVWNMLSREIGRERFRRIMHGITRRYAFQQVTLKELWREIEKAAGRDLQWFYEQWFERLGAPEFQLTWKQAANEVSGTITQTAPYYRATIEIEIESPDKQRSVHTIAVSGARTEFAFPVSFRAQAVTLDPHYQILRWTRDYRAAAEAAATAPPK